MKKLFLLAIFVFLCSFSVFPQINLPRESQRQEISQTVGDAKVSIVYHRPNTKGRKIWGCETEDVIPKGGATYPCLVPNGQVWRTGANENTTIEFSRDVTINGQNLPAGKYGFHTIPNKAEWILVFNKVNDAWGSYSYDEKNDALRVRVVPQKIKENRDTMMFEFASVTPRTTNVVISWEKVQIPFTVDIGDVYGRNLSLLREAIKNRKEDDARPLNQAANYVRTFKIKENYPEALDWIESSIKIRETFANLSAKAGLLAEMGKSAEAITTAEKAIEVGKNSTPPANPNAIASLEGSIKEWKNQK